MRPESSISEIIYNSIWAKGKKGKIARKILSSIANSKARETRLNREVYIYKPTYTKLLTDKKQIVWKTI